MTAADEDTAPNPVPAPACSASTSSSSPSPSTIDTTPTSTMTDPPAQGRHSTTEPDVDAKGDVERQATTTTNTNAGADRDADADVAELTLSLRRPSLQDDEAAQLADFDRYLDTHLDADPAPPSPPAAPALDTFARSFPDYDREALAAVLAACAGDTGAARRMLRDATPPDAPTQPPPLEPDAMAMTEPPQPQEPQGQVPRLPPRLHVRPRRPHLAVHLEPDHLRQLVSSLRDIVIPALRAHFSELILPDKTTESSTFVYRLEHLQVAALNLPSDAVAVQPAADGRTILVNVVGANLELEVGRWTYENRAVISVSDSGRARVSAHGLNVAMRLDPRWAPQTGTRIVVTQCDVTIDGVVRFKTQGAAADWAYNAIAIVFKPWVVSYIKESVADAVVRALAVHLRQWEFATGVDQPAPGPPNAPSSNTANPPVVASE